MSRSSWTEPKKTRARDGAHRLTTPVVGCAQATTGRPPGGAGAVVTMTTPEKCRQLACVRDFLPVPDIVHPSAIDREYLGCHEP